MTGFDWSGLEVRSASTELELANGMSFVKDKYSLAYDIGTTKPEFLFLAYKDSEIIGSFGMNTDNVVGGSRLPGLYELNSDMEISFIKPENSVEFGRWISGSREVTSLLVYRAIILAISLNKRYVWCEQGRAVHRAASMFGVAFHLVSEKVIGEKVEDYYINFYAREQPRLYYFELDQAVHSIKYYLKNKGYEEL